MADIELVIKIPEELYKSYKGRLPMLGDIGMDMIAQSIANGTPLPQGHGDLIDRRELKKDVYTTTEWNGDVHRIIYEASVDDAPTILEADKEACDDSGED